MLRRIISGRIARAITPGSEIAPGGDQIGRSPKRLKSVAEERTLCDLVKRKASDVFRAGERRIRQKRTDQALDCLRRNRPDRESADDDRHAQREGELCGRRPIDLKYAWIA
jgi:hypothetical protein